MTIRIIFLDIYIHFFCIFSPSAEPQGSLVTLQISHASLIAVDIRLILTGSEYVIESVE